MSSLDSALYAFTNAIQPVRRAWMQAAGTAFAEAGLSNSLATVVLFVSRLGPQTQQKTLAQEVGVNPAALARMLDQGETAGLLVRNEIPGDRRSKTVDLLPKGARLASRLEEAIAVLRSKLLADVPLSDIKTTIRVLRLLEERSQAHVDSMRAKGK